MWVHLKHILQLPEMTVEDVVIVIVLVACAVVALEEYVRWLSVP